MSDLTGVLREALEQKGVLDELKGRVRAEVFKALEDRTIERPKVPSENHLINELIREYLEFNGYHHTLSTLLHETRHPKQPLDRDFLQSELRISVQPDNVPLLYGMVSHCAEPELEESETRQPLVTIVRK